MLTHNLELVNDEISGVIDEIRMKIRSQDYSLDAFSQQFDKLYTVLRKHNHFPKIVHNEFHKIASEVDIYLDTLTWHVLTNYTKFVRNDDLPVYCYVYMLIDRPYLYNVLMCMRTNDEIVKFKSEMFEIVKEIVINNASKRIVSIKELLETNEFECYDKVSSLQQFKYFIDGTFWSNFRNFMPNTAYIVVHLSYNNNNLHSIFAYNKLDSNKNIVALTEEYARQTKVIKEFPKIYVKKQPYTIVDSTFRECSLKNNNVFVLCADNAPELKDCYFTVVQFVNHNQSLNKHDAERKLDGEIYKSIAFEQAKINFDISNNLKIYDNPAVVDKDKEMKFKSEIAHLCDECVSYKDFLSQVIKSMTLKFTFDNDDEWFYFTAYLRGYDDDYDKSKILKYVYDFYEFDV